MLTSAEKTGYSEVLIFILELLSEVKSDCHEILSGALVYGDLKNDQRIFVSSGLVVVEIEAR